MENGDTKEKNNKIYVALIIALILLAIGAYLYFFYPQIIPGLGGVIREDVNVLVIGLDDTGSNEDEEKITAEVFVLASLKPDENKAEFSNIVMPESELITDYHDDYKDEIVAVADEVIRDSISADSTDSEVIDKELKYYFTISYQGFTNMIDNIGGVTIVLDEDIKVPGLDLDLEEGENLLNGKETLNFARWYDYEQGESGRASRQQKIVSALSRKIIEDRTVQDIPELFRILVDTYNSVDTNLEYTTVKNIIDYVMDNEPEIKYNMIEVPAEEEIEDEMDLQEES